MIHNILKRIIFLSLLWVLPLIISAKDIKKETEGDRRARGLESQADRKFIQQDFDKAMEIYEEALKQQLSVDYSAALHLKTARLYLTLLDYVSAIPHYETAMALSEELFSSVDVCNFLDALRFSGQKMKAIGIARKYAYQDTYHADQRYQNILHALNYEDGFLPVGTPEFSIRVLDNANTANSEFWIGVKEGEYFYASSKSRFHDPNKKFYHRSGYFSLNENSEYSIKNQETTKKRLLDMIPIDLQNGPMSFSRNMTRMVVTQVSYEKGEGIGMTKQGLSTFQTKLYYSNYDEKRKGWSSFKEAFPQKPGYSYSHPFLFDNDRSLLFASDMPGGYGGYDIYVTQWDDRNNTWGEPVNLGAQVNTEGDEISPGIFEDMFIFSSNGHVGFGGYDIYGISYENGHVVAGSLVHFDYPINTVLNDFSLLHIDGDRGYVVSDRNVANKDDIFYFERNKREIENNNLLFGMSEAQAISNGSINLAREERKINVPRQIELPSSRFMEHMVSVYFDFDSHVLRDDTMSELDTWRKKMDFNQVDTLFIEGYADEIGREEYNLSLSTKRAKEVADRLALQGVNVEFMIFGKGQLPLNLPDTLGEKIYKEDTPGHSYKDLLMNKIWLNRDARRVDIKAITK
ncbi:MAG: OmpA family protein [Prevotella sp.]|jgi:outer membrane protein OmpA-like peptidoglycan-associated protein/tetratricopeptide (TPR) repeat protein|nr:OmpA family protein [Prevotella sp.]